MVWAFVQRDRSAHDSGHMSGYVGLRPLRFGTTLNCGRGVGLCEMAILTHKRHPCCIRSPKNRSSRTAKFLSSLLGHATVRSAIEVDRNSVTLDDDQENHLISELVNLQGAVKIEDPWPGRRSGGAEVAVSPVGGGEHHRLALEPMAGGDLVRVAEHLATRHVTLS